MAGLLRSQPATPASDDAGVRPGPHHTFTYFYILAPPRTEWTGHSLAY